MDHYFDSGLRDVIYLNAASRTPLPLCVAQRGRKVLTEKQLPWTIGSEEGGVPAAESIRSYFLRLVGPAVQPTADSSAVAITPSTSFAVSAAAKNLSGKAQKVIVLEDQMSSNVLSWQAMKGIEIEAIPRPDDGDWTPAILRSMRPGQSTVLALPHVHWVDGAAINLHQVSKACSDYNHVLFVDATQSLGAVPLEAHGPLPRLDFLCASVHKWLFGCYGCAPLYVDAHRYPNLEPLVYDEHALAGADDDISLPFNRAQGGYSYQKRKPGARPLDAGGRPNPIILPMVAEALRFLLDDLGGPAAIQNYLLPLASRFTEQQSSSWKYPRYRFHHILGLRPSTNWTNADECAFFLKQKHRIHLTGRFGALRVAFHVYNSTSDVDALISALDSWLSHERSKEA